MVQFAVTKEELSNLNEARDVNTLNELGGVEGLAKSLCTDIIRGLSASEEEEATQFFDRKRVYDTQLYSTIFLSFN
jgi:hypothetical protein